MKLYELFKLFENTEFSTYKNQIRNDVETTTFGLSHFGFLSAIGMSSTNRRNSKTFRINVLDISSGDLVFQEVYYKTIQDIPQDILNMDVIKIDHFALKEYDYISGANNRYFQNHSFIKITVKKI
jgi:hypothetical protein